MRGRGEGESDPVTQRRLAGTCSPVKTLGRPGSSSRPFPVAPGGGADRLLAPLPCGARVSVFGEPGTILASAAWPPRVPRRPGTPEPGARPLPRGVAPRSAGKRAQPRALKGALTAALGLAGRGRKTRRTVSSNPFCDFSCPRGSDVRGPASQGAWGGAGPGRGRDGRPGTLCGLGGTACGGL